MHDLLFGHQTQLKNEDLRRYAAEAALNMARYTAEMDDHIYLQRIREHTAGGRQSRVRATPCFFLDGAPLDISFGMRTLHEAVVAAIRLHDD